MQIPHNFNEFNPQQAEMIFQQICQQQAEVNVVMSLGLHARMWTIERFRARAEELTRKLMKQTTSPIILPGDLG